MFEFEGTTEAEDKQKRKPKQSNVTGMRGPAQHLQG